MINEAELKYIDKEITQPKEKNDDIVITGVNEKNIAKIPEGKKPVTIKSLAKKSGIAGILTTLASSGLFIFFGNLGEDAVISTLEHWATRFQFGAGGVPKSVVLSRLFRFVEGGVSVAWATVMANPLAAAVLVGAFMTTGGFVIGLGKKIFSNHKKMGGKVYTVEDKKRTKED